MAKQLKGVLGTKLGMTQVFNDQGKVVPVTVVAAGPCVVTAVRTAPQDGYAAVQLGYGEIDPRRVTKPVAGHFAKAGGTPRKHRSPGSIGGCATPGRVFKGLKMAGRMGNARTTVPRLTVHAVDAERGLLLIKGAVPGPKGSLVQVRSAAKRH